MSAAALPAPPAAPDWRLRIIAALARHADAARPSHSDLLPAGPVVPAAVLVPIVLGSEPSVLLTRRADTLSAPPGQVSFPGGRIEPGDAGARAAALRETREEIGLPPAAVEVAGRLPRHLTGTGFAISPLVGLLHPPLALAPDPREVAELFELPLAVLLDEHAARREQAEFRGQLRHFWVIPHARYHIWGATAAILVNLGRVLRAGQ